LLIKERGGRRAIHGKGKKEGRRCFKKKNALSFMIVNIRPTVILAGILAAQMPQA